MTQVQKLVLLAHRDWRLFHSHLEV